MEYIKNTYNFKYNNTAVTLGKFDGVHMGHCLLLDRLKTFKKYDLIPVMFTFDIYPANLFSDKEIKHIYTEEEKRRNLEKIGIDILIAYPFTNKTAGMDAKDFVKDILIDKLDCKAIVTGEDFRFGYKKKGDIKLLRELSYEYGFDLVVYEKLKYNYEVVSSTLIRTELIKGNIKKVNKLLGRPFSIVGIVICGNKIGRTINFPTINILPDKSKLLPPNGVYVSKVKIDEKVYNSVSNIGIKPTVTNQSNIGIETYIFDFNEDIYDKEVEIMLYEFLRPEKKFNSISELKNQIELDKNITLNYFLTKDI